MSGRQGMWEWRARAPVWLIGSTSGTYFGVCMAVVGRLRDEPISWWGTLVVGVFGGVFFGAFMAWQVHRTRTRERALMGDPSPADELRIRRAVLDDDPLPGEHRLREAADRLAADTFQRLQRNRDFAPLQGLLLLGFCVWQVITTSGWFLLLAVLVGIGLCRGELGYRRLRARLPLLRAAAADGSSAAGEGPQALPS